MSIVSVTELVATITDVGFTTKRGFQAKYTRHFLVIVNNAADPAILALYASGIPVAGSQAILAFVGLPLYVTSSTARRDSKSQLHWYVDVNYEAPEQEKGSKHPDHDKEDPLKMRDTVEWTPAKFTRPVDTAALIGVGTSPGNMYGGFPGYKQQGAQIHPMNAAGEKYDPPPERDSSRTILRITKRMSYFPQEVDSNYAEFVNSQPFSINKPGLSITFPARSAKLEPLSGTLKYHMTRSGQEIPYWDVVVELAYTYLAQGWHFVTPNVGLCARALVGDPDGYGGKIVNGQIPVGQPPIRRMKDPDGRVYSHPVPLDASGQPIQNTNQDVLFVEWQVYKEADFGNLQFSTDNQL
jgi:hypothetical protein